MSNIYKYMGRQTPAVLYCEKEYNLLPGERYGPIIRNVYIIECCVEGYGSVTVNNKEYIECDKLVLALGHSARDTFKMLYNK